MYQQIYYNLVDIKIRKIHTTVIFINFKKSTGCKLALVLKKYALNFRCLFKKKIALFVHVNNSNVCEH